MMRAVVPFALAGLLWATIRYQGWRIDRHAQHLHNAGGDD